MDFFFELLHFAPKRAAERGQCDEIDDGSDDPIGHAAVQSEERR